MGQPSILFNHLEIDQWEIDFNEIRSWLQGVATAENKAVEELTYVFCTDAFLLDLNRRHLNHDTLTDIITFPDSYNPIQAEIYISLERVSENAISHGDGDKNLELFRVILHGLLHMCRYDDKTDLQRAQMRKKEDWYLTKSPN